MAADLACCSEADGDAAVEAARAEAAASKEVVMEARRAANSLQIESISGFDAANEAAGAAKAQVAVLEGKLAATAAERECSDAEIAILQAIVACSTVLLALGVCAAAAISK